MLVLADRYYSDFLPLWSRAAGTGADLLWRFKSNMKFPVIEEFDDGSRRSVFRGSGSDRRRSRGELPLRVVTYRSKDSDEPTMFATSPLDHRRRMAAGFRLGNVVRIADRLPYPSALVVMLDEVPPCS